MTQREFLRVWLRVRPSTVTRSKWFRLGESIHLAICNLGFPFREPRFWWFCRRVQLHVWFGLPLPLTDRERGILRA